MTPLLRRAVLAVLLVFALGCAYTATPPPIGEPAERNGR